MSHATYLTADDERGNSLIVSVEQDTTGQYPLPVYLGDIALCGDECQYGEYRHARDLLEEKIREGWSGAESLYRAVTTLDGVRVVVNEDECENEKMASLEVWGRNMFGTVGWYPVTDWVVPDDCKDPIQHVTEWESEDIIVALAGHYDADKLLAGNHAVVRLYETGPASDLRIVTEPPRGSLRPDGYLIMSRDEALSAFGGTPAEAMDKAQEYLEGAAKTVNSWVRGENWHTAVYQPKTGEQTDSCSIVACDWDDLGGVIDQMYDIHTKGTIGEFESIEECLEHLRAEKER